MSQKRYLTIALTKGRLAHDTLELFERIGVNTAGAMDKKTRKLIFTNEELGLRFFLAKGPDVPTYVYYGAADIGIVGRDTIIEENKKLYEVLDLGYGKCRMCVCGPASARKYLEGGDQIRVATKYPNITRAFFEEKNMDVRVIKIEGSVELAPLVGLSDGIVDIVETGSTLKANGLEVIEWVTDISARLIANTASLKLRKNEIEALQKKLEAVTK